MEEGDKLLAEYRRRLYWVWNYLVIYEPEVNDLEIWLEGRKN